MAGVGVLGGTAYIKADGIDLILGAEMSFQVDQTSREFQSGLGGPAGVTEKIVPAFVKGKAFATPETKLAALNKIRSGTVSIEMNSGIKAVFQGAACVKCAEIDANTGEFEFEFHAKKGRYL